MLRTDAETLLLKRLGPKMTEAGLDGTTIGGNVDLIEPMIAALFAMGIVPASMVAVTDADLSGVDSDMTMEFLDRAELRLLENVAGSLALVDISIGPRRESLSQLSAQVEKAIERVTAKLARLYGVGVGTLSAGVIGLDFMEKSEDA